MNSKNYIPFVSFRSRKMKRKVSRRELWNSLSRTLVPGFSGLCRNSPLLPMELELDSLTNMKLPKGWPLGPSPANTIRKPWLSKASLQKISLSSEISLQKCSKTRSSPKLRALNNARFSPCKIRRKSSKNLISWKDYSFVRLNSIWCKPFPLSDTLWSWSDTMAPWSTHGRCVYSL